MVMRPLDGHAKPADMTKQGGKHGQNGKEWKRGNPLNLYLFAA
jgi:hypothetical protein